MYNNRIFLSGTLFAIFSVIGLTGVGYADDTVTALASQEYVDAYVGAITENMQTTDNMQDTTNVANYSATSAGWDKGTVYPSVNTVETIAQYFVNQDLLTVAGDVTNGMLLTISETNNNELVATTVDTDNIANNAITFDKLNVPEECQAASNQCLLGVRKGTGNQWELYWEITVTAADV